MQCVMEIMGPPPAALMERATRKEQFFEADGSVRITANKAGLRRFPGSKDLSQALRCNDGPFLSFLQVRLLPICLNQTFKAHNAVSKAACRDCAQLSQLTGLLNWLHACLLDIIAP